MIYGCYCQPQPSGKEHSCGISRKMFIFMILVLLQQIVLISSSDETFPIVVSYDYAQARCKARCLSLYAIRQKKTIKCGIFDDCRECQKICYNEQIADDIRIDCSTLCRDQTEDEYQGICIKSCHFLYNVIKDGKKSGTCPEKPSHIQAFSTIRHQCHSDWMCLAGNKCCSYQKDKMQCEPALFKQANDELKIRIGDIKPTSVHLSWELRKEDYSRGYQFVIEKRLIKDDKENTGFWHYAHQTSKLRHHAKGLKLNGIYQFRVAAVTMDGHHGYTLTTPITLPELNLKPPSAPRNFQVVETILKNDEKTAEVVLSWSPPAELIGTKVRYRLRFSKTLQQGRSKYSMSQKVDIPKDRFLTRLVHLEINQIYHAQIFALLTIGGKVFRGEKAKLHFDTRQVKVRAPPSITVQETDEEPSQSSEMTVVDMKAYIDRVVNQGKYVSIHIMWSPFSNPDINAVKVSWRGEDCQLPKGDQQARVNYVFVRSSLRNYTVSGLDRFCRYRLQLEPHYHYGNAAGTILFDVNTIKRKAQFHQIDTLAVTLNRQNQGSANQIASRASRDQHPPIKLLIPSKS
eukprot:TCONS_00073674-protein